MYIRWSGVNWLCADGTVYNPATGNANISRNGGTSDNASLEIDSLGNPHFSWWDSSYGSLEIVYMYWDGNDWLCADGSVYNPTNYVNNNPVNVSRNTGYSEHPFLELDSSNTPHIVWCDDSYGNTEIQYVSWDGSNWICSNSEIYNPTTGNSNISKSNQDSRIPVMTIDSSQVVWVSWYDTSFGNSEIMLNELLGSTWTVPSEATYDLSTGNANVSRNASDSTKHLANGLQLDSFGYPHIVWSDNANGNYDIYYIHWNGFDWVCADNSVYTPINIPNVANISNNSGDSMQPCLSLDQNSNPHITWSDQTEGNDEVYYVSWNGNSWVCANGVEYVPDLVPTDANVSRNPSGAGGGNLCSPRLALDGNGNPNISWFDLNFGNDEVYFVRWINGNWRCANSDVYDPLTGNAIISLDSGLSRHVSISLDPNDNPFVTWTTSSWEISLIYYDGTNWVTSDGSLYNPATQNANVSTNGTWSARSEVAVDNDTMPHVVWRDGIGANADIFYIRWDGTNWVTVDGSLYNGINANVSNDGVYTDNAQIVVNSQNNPTIAWASNDIDYEVFVVSWNGNGWICANGVSYDSSIPQKINPGNTSLNNGDSHSPTLCMGDDDKVNICWMDTTYGNHEILYARASDSLILPRLNKVVDTNEDDVFTDEFEPVAKCDILTYKVTVSFVSEEQSGILLDTIPECTEFVELVKPTGNVFCNYSDSGWKYYYQYKGTPSGDAKNPMCEIGWWVDAKNGLKQEFIYKVKVRDPARRYLKGKPVGTRLDFRPYVSIKAPKARFAQGKPKGGISNSNWLYNPIEATTSNYNLSSASASQGVNPIGVTDLGGVVSVIDPI
ncbi:MAG TPA: hypothetical protein PLP35_09500, partial [Caldisericia bacterium]|nr:hypothetical protein [Caldisericia bacterium]